MSVETQAALKQAVYVLAETWLIHAGWHNTVDIQRLAERIQSTIEDFESELENHAD
jgi:hypothetical protein